MRGATKTETTTPSPAMSDRLISSGVDFGFDSELVPWCRAAEAVGFQLPAEVAALVDQAVHLADQRHATVRPPDHRAMDVDRVIQGASLAEILDADAEAARLAARWEVAEDLLLRATGAFQGETRDVFTKVRDELITDVLRPAVDALLVEGRTAAEQLRRFGPDFPPNLLADADSAELAVWRDSRSLQAALDTLVQAWSASARVGFPRALRPERAGGWFAWENPESVTPEALRLGIDSEVLRIATAPSEYRLLAPGELPTLIAELDAAAPRDSRGVSIATTSGHQLVRRGMCE